LRVLVERRWPWRLDKASAAIDRWEKQVAPSAELHRWFGGRRARWAEFHTWYGLELGSIKKDWSVQTETVERRVTLLFSAVDPIHNSAAVLREVLCGGPGLGGTAMKMSHAELLSFLNSLLSNSRTTIKEAKAILQRTAARMLDIQRDERPMRARS
jgi:uncharacterized protein YeaO (DUF488 family)